jgi:hypothetical protein
MARLIRFLMPYFLTVTPDFDLARAEILETLASYGARTRSEMLNAAQIIAFGFSALDMLAEAKATEMSASMRLRYRGCANSLNRAGQQNAKTLARRLACDLPDAIDPGAEPADDVSEAAVQEIIQQTQTRIDTCRNRLSGGRPATGPHAIPASRQERNRPLGGTIMATLAEMGMPFPPASATR